MKSKVLNMLLFLGVALLVIALAQALGFWVNNTIPTGTTRELTSLIHLTHVRNYGGVFGLAQGMGWLFGLISLGLLGGVTAYLWFASDIPRLEYLFFGFIVGGGASNVIDRLLYGSVIDYIDVQHIPGWNYVFNLADVMVHVGIWPLILFSILAGRRSAADDA
ncbi:MAG: signal peptidase II [Pseudohongiellaceae bacterium]